MTSRANHEAQIKRFDTTFGGELEDAITTLAFRSGLRWFTDEQIADIRETMMLAELRRHRCNSRIHRDHGAAAAPRVRN